MMYQLSTGMLQADGKQDMSGHFMLQSMLLADLGSWCLVSGKDNMNLHAHSLFSFFIPIFLKLWTIKDVNARP